MAACCDKMELKNGGILEKRWVILRGGLTGFDFWVSDSLFSYEVARRGTNVFRLLRIDELRGILDGVFRRGCGCGCSCCGSTLMYDEDEDEPNEEIKESGAVRRRVNEFVFNLFRVSEKDAFR